MKAIVKLVVLGASLLLVNVTSRVVLTANQHHGVYAIDADSIGIPLAEAASLSMLGAVILLALVALSWLSRAFHKPSSSRRWLFALHGVLALAYLLAVAFFVLWGLSWSVPDHYPIAVSCGLVVIAILFFAAVDFRSLRPDHSSGDFPVNPRA